MAAQVYLVTPADADESFPPRLDAALAAASVAAVLVRRGADASNYEALARQMVSIGQRHGAAVLVEGEPELARRVGADGLHVASIKALKPAMAVLKPDLIVGIGPLSTRHDAMLAGEQEVDYLLFGAPEAELTPEDREFAQWWAETFEIPAVLCDPLADPGTADPGNCEFIGLSASVWQAGDDAPSRLAAIAARVGVE
jgi:thiamine-phosphate pyrophosphorylase